VLIFLYWGGSRRFMFPLLRYKKIDEQFADHQFPYQVCDLSLVGFLHLLHLLPPFLLFSIIEIKFHVSFFCFYF